MPYKLKWKNKESGREDIGLLLGKVEKRVFIPLSLEEAKEKCAYCNRTYTKAVHYVVEVPFSLLDFEELRPFHSFFLSQEIPWTEEKEKEAEEENA